MRTFNEFVTEKEDKDSQYYAELSINNVEKLYQVAMRAKDGKGLEKAMVKMKAQFADADKIDFDKVDWDAAYTDLNEAEKGKEYLIAEAKKKSFENPDKAIAFLSDLDFSQKVEVSLI